MDQIRAHILARNEDRWEVILLESPDDLAVKKFFRNRFELKVHEIKEFVQPGRVLYQAVSKEKASIYQDELRALNCVVKLIHTGISYRGKFTDAQIIETLTRPGFQLTDYVINHGIPTFYTRTHYLLVEDDALASACMEFLLRFGAPIENIK